MEIRKKIIILLIVLVLGVVGIFIYKKNKNQTNILPNSSVLETTTPSVVDQAKKQEFEGAIQKISKTDQDMDGIPDSEAAKYKTDPASADTDGDGLTDWQEVSIFLTDPLKADTDGDTFTDGYEVRHGFNPKGSGKL